MNRPIYIDSVSFLDMGSALQTIVPNEGVSVLSFSGLRRCRTVTHTVLTKSRECQDFEMAAVLHLRLWKDLLKFVSCDNQV
jgi:hypothetical protein